MRVYLYAGPSRRIDADWFFLHLALDRLPGVEAYLFECHGTTSLHGQRDLTLVMDHDLELFGEKRPSWQPPRPFTLITSRSNDEPLLWEGAEKVVRLLPAADPLLWCQEGPVEPLVDVGQYGSLSHDVDVLDRVLHAFPSFSLDTGEVLENAVQRLQRARVVIVDDHPRHLVEVLCLGRPVVARKQPWHADLGLVSGIHYWAYETAAEAVQVVTLTLANENIALGLHHASRGLITTAHTWMHRAVDVLGRTDVTEEEMKHLIEKPLRETSYRDRQLGLSLLPVRR